MWVYIGIVLITQTLIIKIGQGIIDLRLYTQKLKPKRLIIMLEGKIALITGGSKGIGFGIAKALAAQGMNVAITSRDHEAANAAATTINSHYPDSTVGFGCDVRDYTAQLDVANKIYKLWGNIELVVANAGIGHFAAVDDLTIDQWNEMIDTNLTGAFFTLKATLSQLKATKGYYITISSLAGTNFFAGGAGYNASKFGVTGFTQAAMLDIRKHGIRATTIMPGSVATHFNNHIPSDHDAWKIQISDIGQIVVDLMKMHPRTLPSKIEIRPTMPPSA